ncbi:MAG: hypothetical protein IT487_20360 [Chromatiaceae bacterium]|nr:hypothetical protein [Chromatiaceae bacterium]
MRSAGVSAGDRPHPLSPCRPQADSTLQGSGHLALLAGGSPATPDELRKRFETFINDRCKGKDAGKLRFMVE